VRRTPLSRRLGQKNTNISRGGAAGQTSSNERPRSSCQHVENVAKKMLGSAGQSGFDSLALKNVLLIHGHASQRLRVLLLWINFQEFFQLAMETFGED
jgi:hypothetical protein